VSLAAGGTDAPSPTAPRYVFVVTYGRSGSTLTQGLLNTLPRTLVRGENNLYLLPIYRAYTSLATFKGKYGGPRAARPESAFYGLSEVDLDGFAASVRELVQRQLLAGVPLSEVDHLGFKEVLWHRIRGREWEPFFAFLDLAFGNPRYVLNRRDVSMASTSGFWRKKRPGVAERQIDRVRRLQDHLRESRPGRCFDTRFEAIVSDDREVAAAHLRGLAEFVHGTCDDDLLAAMLATRETGHGPNPFGRARTG
jgi:hypothetical protein